MDLDPYSRIALVRLPLRLTPGWPRLLLLLTPPLVGLVAAVALLARPGTSTAPAPVPSDQTVALPTPAGLLIDVTGAVAHPGLYRLPKGERVSAAIAAAGGLAPNADPDRLPDLAQVLRDGQQVKVPALGAPSAGSTRAAKLDLNAATVQQLATVPGFTPEFAQAVVDYRTQYGGFTSVRELVTVLDLSPADFARARPYVRV
ncbi:MAG TPA: helix-hairpin-helix domain-containing protein [Candidatus Dormibacteraeota bacterium]|jgi:competence protein ComEA|nr:helix-hairpin-helix domain-containing protein [Candidatus Dormibacteraeota bacterium]